MFRDSVIAAIRTGVAVIVTYLVTWLVGLGVTLDPDTQTTLNVALFGLFVAIYNFVVSLLERKVNPYFGILLGVPKAPAYGEVGTQTPPPVNPLIGDPKTDRGTTNLVVVGLIIALVGLVVLLVTVADTLGIILLVLGAVVAVVGATRTGRF